MPKFIFLHLNNISQNSSFSHVEKVSPMLPLYHLSEKTFCVQEVIVEVVIWSGHIRVISFHGVIFMSFHCWSYPYPCFYSAQLAKFPGNMWNIIPFQTRDCCNNICCESLTCKKIAFSIFASSRTRVHNGLELSGQNILVWKFFNKLATVLLKKSG